MVGKDDGVCVGEKEGEKSDEEDGRKVGSEGHCELCFFNVLVRYEDDVICKGVVFAWVRDGCGRWLFIYCDRGARMVSLQY